MMVDLAGKVAVVTGASAGVGAAVAVTLANKGMIVVGVARRVEKVQELQKQVTSSTGKIVAIQGDISKQEDITRVFDEVKKQFKTIHVLVNNAGLAQFGMLIDGNPSDWKTVLDVNVMGVATCSRHAIELMRNTGDNGQVININSVAGHRASTLNPPASNIYSPSKFAVTALSETLRNELRYVKSKIRVTNLSPGLIETEFLDVAVRGDQHYDQLKEQIKTWAPLRAQDLADTIVLILSTPPHVQIHELTLTAV